MEEITQKTPQEEAAELLLKHKLTLSCAESCTGGLISASLVEIPGISQVYQCGVVTYANKAKRKLLGVKRRRSKNSVLSADRLQKKWQKEL